MNPRIRKNLSHARTLVLECAAACNLVVVVLSYGCKSSTPQPSPSVTRHRNNVQQGAGAAALRQNPAKDTSNALATIHTSCPADRRYRLPGFSMKCLECHDRRSPDGASAEVVARQKSQTCVANLQYIGLAARTWATNHDGALPFSFAIMANELRSPHILICPAQTNTHKLKPWDILPPKPTWLNATYQIGSPWKRRRDPTSVYGRCPIHGSVLRADGRVLVPAGAP